MYRQRIHLRALNADAYVKLVRLFKRIDHVAQSKGISRATVWTPVAGDLFEVVAESDSPDLATYESEGAVFYGDAELMNLIREADALAVPGSGRLELWQTVELPVDGDRGGTS